MGNMKHAFPGLFSSIDFHSFMNSGSCLEVGKVSFFFCIIRSIWTRRGQIIRALDFPNDGVDHSAVSEMSSIFVII